MTFLILLYGYIHVGFFGLLVGLAAEEAKNWKHYAFLLVLSMFWPGIVFWKLTCDKRAAQ